MTTLDENLESEREYFYLWQQYAFLQKKHETNNFKQTAAAKLELETMIENISYFLGEASTRMNEIPQWIETAKSINRVVDAYIHKNWNEKIMYDPNTKWLTISGELS